MRIDVILSQWPSKSKKRPVNYNYWQVQWVKKGSLFKKEHCNKRGSLRFKLENSYLRKGYMKSEGFMQKSMQACFVDGRMAKVPT